MSMSHRAFAFSWVAFEQDDLCRLLYEALSTGDTQELSCYIDERCDEITDPYEGNPLPEDWRSLLENGDVQEHGDFALTRFYDPADDNGLGGCWLTIESRMTEKQQTALLGVPFGPMGAYFDPGRIGAYFRTPQQTADALNCIRQFSLPDLNSEERQALARFEAFLERCIGSGNGLYVTF